MIKHLITVSLVTSILGVAFPSQVRAVNLYNAGALRSAFGEISNSFTDKYGIPVTQVSAPCGSLRERIEQELSLQKSSADIYALWKHSQPSETV